VHSLREKEHQRQQAQQAQSCAGRKIHG
jgi:hypothetical protein